MRAEVPLATVRCPALVVALALSFAPGCAKAREAAPSSAAVAPAAAPAQPGAPGALPSSNRALRITVETSMIVKDLDAASAALRAEVAKVGGYVGEARHAGGETGGSASFELHVPAPKLAEFRADIAKLGEVAHDAEKSEDVTEQRADLGAR